MEQIKQSHLEQLLDSTPLALFLKSVILPWVFTHGYSSLTTSWLFTVNSLKS